MIYLSCHSRAEGTMHCQLQLHGRQVVRSSRRPISAASIALLRPFPSQRPSGGRARRPPASSPAPVESPSSMDSYDVPPQDGMDECGFDEECIAEKANVLQTVQSMDVKSMDEMDVNLIYDTSSVSRPGQLRSYGFSLCILW